MKVAINGLGRIGRLVFRQLMQQQDIELVAVNDLVPADCLAYLINYDSTHGRAPFKVSADGKNLSCQGKTIEVLAERDPRNLPWKELGVDYVIEATGHFTAKEKAALHLEAGAARVLITAPAKGEVPTIVMGVNHESFNPKSDLIISNASCTTNCLAPLAKVLEDEYGIEEGLMTTVHAATASQPVVDGPSAKDLRGGRSCLQNIIPASTGAAKAVTLCLPSLKGKLTGMAFRVPTVDVSVVDLTVRLKKSSSYEEICAHIKEKAEGPMKGILLYTEEPLVSSDFIGSPYSCIFDANAGIALNDRFYKMIAWYDNEMGYSCRILDLLKYVAPKI